MDELPSGLTNRKSKTLNSSTFQIHQLHKKNPKTQEIFRFPSQFHAILGISVQIETHWIAPELSIQSKHRSLNGPPTTRTARQTVRAESEPWLCLFFKRSSLQRLFLWKFREEHRYSSISGHLGIRKKDGDHLGNCSHPSPSQEISLQSRTRLYNHSDELREWIAVEYELQKNKFSRINTVCVCGVWRGGVHDRWGKGRKPGTTTTKCKQRAEWPDGQLAARCCCTLQHTQSTIHSGYFWRTTLTFARRLLNNGERVFGS